MPPPFVSPNPPLVACRLSALRRAATMARMSRVSAEFSPQSYARILANSAAVILSPRLASILFPSILVPAFIGELSFAVWLTVKGVNVARWREAAERATR
jgi:hypothetical protein